MLKNNTTAFFASALICMLMSLCIISCKTSDPVSLTSKQAISLSVKEKASVEAWLELKLENINLPVSGEIDAGRQVMAPFKVYSSDTIFDIVGLLPNHTYTFSANISNQKESIPSAAASVTTLDTTSHDFRWQTFVFPGSCKDVSIENDTSIWVAGQFTTGNAAHWNGREWKFFRLKYYEGIGSNSTTDALEGEAIHVFPGGKVIVCANSEITYLVNEKQIMTYWLPVSANRIWAADTNDIYIAGSDGWAAHYDGKSWTRIVTGTSLDLQDVWGVKDRLTGETTVLTIASDALTSYGNELFKLTKTTATPFTTDGLTRYGFSSLWFKSTSICYLTGDNIYQNNSFNGSEIWKECSQQVSQYYLYGIRGNGLNDMVMGGSFGEIVHFNGKSWRSYLGNEVQEFNGNLISIDMKGNIICTVGYGVGDGNIGVIMLGKRN